jgi:hypothetical protein
MTTERAESFSRDWIAAWNAHDLDRILSHYSDDVVFSSPFAVELAGAEDGIVRGTSELRTYFARGLQAYPDLYFELIASLAGANSVALYYRSVGGREAIEVMELDSSGLVCRVIVHYSAPRETAA